MGRWSTLRIAWPMNSDAAGVDIPSGAPAASRTVLVLIDRGTAERDHWSDLQPELLGQIGIYDVWRLDRSRLEQRAQTLKADGVDADWQEPRPERY